MHTCDSFVIYRYDNGDSIIGTVTSIIQKNILGIADSVKTISLTSNHLQHSTRMSTVLCLYVTIYVHYYDVKFHLS